MKFGTLDFTQVTGTTELVAPATAKAINNGDLQAMYVAEIDPALSDTAAFCERYKIGMNVSANCVVVEAKRADKTWYAVCVILATDRADINGTVRRYLDARKISFAPMETATSLTGMEFGGITPIGLPSSWPILVDSAVAATEWAIIGSGVRKSKLLVPGSLLAKLPQAISMDIVKRV
jgi:prolyl-tRNA editing enzyme YbaK/EbsC (Cys-tRNA(Pro) deacylase)